MAQVALSSLFFVILAIPVGFGISHIVFGFIRPQRNKNAPNLVYRGGVRDDQ
jgi:hypothetical protein